MSIYMSRAELEEISEGLITAYANKFSNRVIQSIDIEHFITEFLMLRIEYASFAEDDAGRIGFLADGATPLLVHQDGKIIPFVFPKDTIVLDKFLLAEKEQGRRRFTMAHEASHHILSKMYAMPSEGRFHAEYDSERSYSKEELAQMFASVEWQADTMGASLLMPRRIIENALAKYNQSNPIKVYGDNTITSKDKAVIRRMAAYIGVSYTALVIRLRDKELAIMFDDPFERAEEERLELEREELRQCEIRKARIALSMLQPLQRERLMKNVCCGLSSRAIAKQEGVYYSSVDKSIAAAKKNFIKFYENL